MNENVFLTELNRLDGVVKTGDYLNLNFDFTIDGADYGVEIQIQHLPEDSTYEHTITIHAFMLEKVKMLKQIKYKSDVTFFKTLEDYKNTAESYLILTLALIRASETEE